MPHAPVTDWWDADQVAALPPYFAEPLRRRGPSSGVEHRSPPTDLAPRNFPEFSSAWLTGAQSRTGSTSCSLLTVSRRVELPPTDAVSAVRYWCWEHRDTPCITAGRDHLELGHPDAAPLLGYLCRVFGRLHVHLIWPAVRVELDLTAWSVTESQVELRPRRIPRGEFRERRFFRAAHAVIEELVAQMTAG